MGEETSGAGFSRQERRRASAVAIGAITLEAALVELIAPLLPQIEQRTGAGPGALGSALAAYALPVVILSIPLGAAANRIGRRHFLVGGLALTAVGSLLIGASHSIALLLGGRTLQGLGAVASWIAAMTIVSDLAPPQRRGQALGYALSAVGIGSLAGPLVGGVGSDLIGFEAPFLIVAMIGALLAGAAATVRLPLGSGEAPGGRAVDRLRAALRRAPGLLGATTALVAAGATGLIEIVVPLDSDARFDLSAGAIGLLFTGAIAIEAVLAPLGGRWGDRRGRGGPAAAGLALLAASLLTLATLPGLILTAIALAILGAGLGLTFAAALPWLDEAFGAADRSLAYGALNLVYAAGYLVGPALGGLLYGRSGAALAYLAAAAAVASVAPLILSPRARPNPPPDRP